MITRLDGGDGVTNAVFVGWSDGGNLALDITMHQPQLARKIVTSGANFSHTVQMAAAIPGAELAIFPHCGHDVVLADAAHWNAVVLALLSEGPVKTE